MIVILHNIRSLHNVGSIFRTADAVGAEKIYICGITPTPTDRFGRVRSQFAKVALDAEKTVPWEWQDCEKTTTLKTIKRLKRDGYKIFAVEQSKDSIPYYKLPKSLTKNSKFGLVVGNEVNGLPPSILKLADKVLEIPMRGQTIKNARHPKNIGRGKESLNVAVAFGIVAFRLAEK